MVKQWNLWSSGAVSAVAAPGLARIKTSKQLRSYMDEVLKAMARGEVERGWAARRAVHGGGAPAAWVRAQALADLRQSAAQQQPAAHLARQL